MKRAALFLMLAVTLVLARLISPASGQTAISPEVTPEATVEVMPPGFEWVMRSDQQCSLSPDETLLAVAGDGVYQLSDRSLKFAFEEPSGQRAYGAWFILDGSHVAVNGDGVYKVASGQRLLSLSAETNLVVFYNSAYARTTSHGKDKMTQSLYDMATWEPVFPPFEFGISERLTRGFFQADEVMPAMPGIYIHGDTVLTYDLTTLTANVYDFASQDLLYTRTFDGIFTVDPTNTYLAVSGEDIRTLRTNEVMLEDLPVFTPMGQGRTRFSTDGQLALVERENEAVVYSLPDGAELARLPLNLVWGEFKLSEDGQSLVINIRTEYSEEAEPVVTYSIDLATHTVEGFDLSTVLIPVGQMSDEFIVNWSFSKDGRYYAGHNAIYETDTGELVVALDPSIGNGTLLSADGSLAARAGDGVYDLVAKRKLYSLRNDSVEISRDGRFVWSRRVGVLDARTGDLLYAMPEKGYYSFSSGSKYLKTSGYQACNILALPDTQE
jgi:hypothetical protein